MARFIPLVIGLVVLVIALSWPRSELTSKTFLNQIYSATGQFDNELTKATWNDKEVAFPSTNLAAAINQKPPNVLGDTTEVKWVDIDLTTQRLVAYEGTRVVFDFPVSTGMPWTPTVTGEFYIWAKVRAQRMTGPGYDLPNVPFVQYFYKGYGIHGAYWHANWGHPISHGCVNMKIPDAQALYYWTNPVLSENQYANTKIKPQESTRVVVHGTTPSV